MDTAAKISRAVIRRPSGFPKHSTPRRRLSSRSPATDKPAKRIELTPKTIPFMDSNNKKSSGTPLKRYFETGGCDLEDKDLAKRIELSPKLDSFFTPEKKKSSETSKKGILETVGSDLEDEGLRGSLKVNALRRSILEEAMNNLPAHGTGRVMYMVKTFERLQSVVMMAEYVEGEETGKVKNWALPGLECRRPKGKLNDFPPSPVPCSAEYLAEEGALTEYSLVKTKDRRLSSGSNESCKVQRNDQNSKGPSKRRNDRLKAKSSLPFKLSAKVSKHINFLEQIKQERGRLLKESMKVFMLILGRLGNP